MSGPAPSGSFYSVELRDPVWTGSACSATLAVQKRVSGFLTLLTSTTVPCGAYTNILTVLKGNRMRVWVTGTWYLDVTDSSLTVGQPGVGVRQTGSGSSMSVVTFGVLDRTAPSPVDPQSIGTSVYPYSVDMQWEEPSDGPNGITVRYYLIYRDGQFVEEISRPEYTDEAVAPSTTYQYSIIARDMHLNDATATAFTVVMPPFEAYNQRRVGVRPTGTYWGAGGEQIDLYSGNLNYTLPLVKAMGRGNWGVTFSLSYNSQLWRKDGGVTWKLGRDVGYGLGWRLQAGSITPYWSDSFTVHHYTFIDSTSAEYRLCLKPDGKWRSSESIYLTYDPPTRRLYFPDGSFWFMDCLSTGNEEDAGTRYPTLMQDTNGNQVLIRYAAGVNLWWENSSARIKEIEDVRATQNITTYRSYSFTYTAEAQPMPHLTQIDFHIGAAKQFRLEYFENQALWSPFSPLGKVKRVSQPYAPGGTVYWTTYSYDALGRTLTVTAPDNSVTSYLYQGNTVKVTDPALKWKKYVMNALGSLTKVIEPNPAGGADLETNYSYNVRNQLTLVSMPRGGTTQTRTFNYDLATGRLTSQTMPESGTTSYSYHAWGGLATKTDAKNQQVQYSYDSFRRTTQVRRYNVAGGAESTCQRVDYYYDSNPFSGSYTQNPKGRLAATRWGGASCDGGEWREMYSYSIGGLALKKRLVRVTYNSYLEASWTYDNEGKAVSVSYPNGGKTYTYSFDAMQRPIKLTDNTAVDWAKDVTYGPAGEMTQMKYTTDGTNGSYYTETRQYNNLLQLTRLTVPGVIDHEYRFTAGANNGRIYQRKDWVSGEEITYQYDSLQRLISAETTGPEWGQSFGFDGFGNLLSQTVTKGSAPSLQVTHSSNGTEKYRYDPANRRVWRLMPSGIHVTMFFGLGGERMGRYAGTTTFTTWGVQVYFTGKLIWDEDAGTVADRLGSVVSGNRKYFPYGEEPVTTGNNRTKFATYFRDGTTALDYADQRYYGRTMGRFLTPDPYGGSANLMDPQSWNRYSYVHNDPVNFNDPTGRQEGGLGDISCWIDGSQRWGLECLWYYPQSDRAQLIAETPSKREEIELKKQAAQHQSPLQLYARTIAAQVADLLWSNSDCALLFSPGSNPSVQLTEMIENSKIRATPFNEFISPGTGAQYNRVFDVIYIASNRYFFTGILANGTSALDTVEFGGLTMVQMQQTIIIHELLHRTGAAGSDSKGEMIVLPNGRTVVGSTGITLAVKESCFRVGSQAESVMSAPEAPVPVSVRPVRLRIPRGTGSAGGRR